MFSLIILGVGIVGMIGWFSEDYRCYFASLITLVAGIWTKQPRLKRQKKGKYEDRGKKKDKKKSRVYVEGEVGTGV